MKTYDPKEHVVTLGGLILQGFAENKFISVKRVSPTFTDQVGASGEVVRSKSNDRRGEVTFTVLASSTVNDALSALITLDEQTGAGVGAFQVVDLNGTSVQHSPNAWISKWPDWERGKESGENEWTFRLDNLTPFVGGEEG
jgi:Protein of unknown function (DUF3277)